MEYSRSIYRDVRSQSANKFDIPFLDMRDIFFEGDLEISKKLEQKHGLNSALSTIEHDTSLREVTLILRVVFPPDCEPVERCYVSFVCINDFWKQVHQIQWDRVKYELSDDGKNGDQKANDGVWSIAVTVPQNRLIKYFFIIGGGEEKWTEKELGVNPGYWVFSRFTYTDKEYLNKFMIKTHIPRVYLVPISTYGAFNYLSEPIHQNIDGNKLIAQELAPLVISELKEIIRERKYLVRPPQ